MQIRRRFRLRIWQRFRRRNRNRIQRRLSQTKKLRDKTIRGEAPKKNFRVRLGRYGFLPSDVSYDFLEGFFNALVYFFEVTLFLILSLQDFKFGLFGSHMTHT